MSGAGNCCIGTYVQVLSISSSAKGEFSALAGSPFAQHSLLGWESWRSVNPARTPALGWS